MVVLDSIPFTGKYWPMESDTIPYFFLLLDIFFLTGAFLKITPTVVLGYKIIL